jgi:hypothetical protein
MENSETRAARSQALAIMVEANEKGDMPFLRQLLKLFISLMPEEQPQPQPDTAAAQAPADNNGYCFVSAENDSASIIVLKHQIYGRQKWQRSYLSEPDICTVTGQELLRDWLAYWPPVDARNAGEVIGEAGIRRLLKCG